MTSLSYAQLQSRVRRLAAALRAAGVGAGDRIAVLSENRIEYIELELAAAQLGVIVACLNWRLADDELLHCIRLVTPALLIVSPRYAATLARIAHGVPRVVGLGDEFDRLLRRRAPAADVDDRADPEAGLVILYTSGTTGLPKGALISQRAMLARAQVFAGDYGIGAADSFVAWSPLFHMAATDHALATLMLGGKVIVHDGLQVDRLLRRAVTASPVGWLLAMPGMIDPLVDALQAQPRRLRGAAHGRRDGRPGAAAPDRRAHAAAGRAVPEQLRLHRDRPAAGLGRAAGARRAADLAVQARIGPVPRSGWSMAMTARCPMGEPGELTIRGPTLFCGYWNARRGQCAGLPRRLVPHAATCSCATPTARWISSTGSST